MADPEGFTLPTPQEFDTFIEIDPAADASDYTNDQKLWLIRTAADLMLLATGMGNPGFPVPDANSPLGRMVQSGILDMAFSLGSSFDDRAAQQFSPFTSERIGSYSYSRMFSKAQQKQDTGVPLFDAAVNAYASSISSDDTSGATGQFAHNSEQVFKTGFKNYEDQLCNESKWRNGWSL